MALAHLVKHFGLEPDLELHLLLLVSMGVGKQKIDLPGAVVVPLQNFELVVDEVAVEAMQVVEFL